MVFLQVIVDVFDEFRKVVLCPTCVGTPPHFCPLC